MDAMEDMDGMDILTGSNPTMQPDCHMLGKGVIPGLRYHYLGKSGLKVGFHTWLIKRSERLHLHFKSVQNQTLNFKFNF